MAVPVDIARRHPKLDDIGSFYAHHHATTLADAILTLEHDAEKCARFSGDIMLYFFDFRADSDFRSSRPKIIRL